MLRRKWGSDASPFHCHGRAGCNGILRPFARLRRDPRTGWIWPRSLWRAPGPGPLVLRSVLFQSPLAGRILPARHGGRKLRAVHPLASPARGQMPAGYVGRRWHVQALQQPLRSLLKVALESEFREMGWRVGPAGEPRRLSFPPGAACGMTACIGPPIRKRGGQKVPHESHRSPAWRGLSDPVPAAYHAAALMRGEGGA
jgi:hypothetical protein